MPIFRWLEWLSSPRIITGLRTVGKLLLAQPKCSQGLNLDQFNISDDLFLAAALFAIAWLYVSVDWRFATAHHREFLLAPRREQWCGRARFSAIFIKISEIDPIKDAAGADEDQRDQLLIRSKTFPEAVTTGRGSANERVN